MSKTSHFQLDYLDPYQLTSQDVYMDARRFTTIDNNLYALMKIFGNGVIVLESTEFPLYVEVFTDSNATKQITVTAGRAFVNYKSINYTTSTTLSLPEQVGTSSSQKYYLYLKDTNSTPETEQGEFYFSSVKLASSDSYIGLGAVQIDYSTGSTQYFDDSDNGRQIINVKRLLLSFINSHYHTGGLGNPKKINLSEETIGELNPDAISYVDASKIRGGQLSQYVAPQVDHNKLYNTGNLSHSQIDSALLSNRDSLNLEIIASLNQLKVVARIMRTTTESTTFSATSGSYASGPIATIDTGLANVWIYCPDISSDRFIVGHSGAAGTFLPSIYTSSSGPFYSATPMSKMAHINRSWNTACIDYIAVPAANTQKVLTAQYLNLYNKINQYGQTGYPAGFVAGLDYTPNSGSAHLVHIYGGQSGASLRLSENYQCYNLTVVNDYNSTLSYGFSGVQFACLFTNLTNFDPTHVCNYSSFSNILLSSDSTGPRILSPYSNGYFNGLTPVNFFATSGPDGAVQSFYYETTTGPKALLFNTGALRANLGASDYSLNTLGSGRLFNIGNKIVLGEFSNTSLRVTELGPTGAIQQVSIFSNGITISKTAISSFEDENSYRIFYIDNNRLYLTTENSSVELGYFAGVTDMIVKYGRLFILASEGGYQKLYYAYEAGYPTVFTQISLNTSAPSASVLDVFEDNIGNIFINVVSNGYYHVFDLSGKEIYKYQAGAKFGSGPLLKSMYVQFDLGDATIDVKYG
jgi:hypothetical protein